MTGKVLQINDVNSALSRGRERGHAKRVEGHGQVETDVSGTALYQVFH